ncbi:MAG: hypothetical protein ACT6QU_19070 [Aliihoeflea sp.]|uniref:hypothetical protein n=1 Tax=Aliihoeflea sp. TaxID=2608088 RepID=UPI0040341C76
MTDHDYDDSIELGPLLDGTVSVSATVTAAESAAVEIERLRAAGEPLSDIDVELLEDMARCLTDEGDGEYRWVLASPPEIGAGRVIFAPDHRIACCYHRGEIFRAWEDEGDADLADLTDALRLAWQWVENRREARTQRTV